MKIEMFDFGKLMLFIVLTIYFGYRFKKERLVSDLILSLIFLLGVTAAKFIFPEYRTVFQSNIIYIVVNNTILVIVVALIIYYGYVKIKSRKNMG
ncbi:putative membrane protein [Clostridium bornimense]|uniref:Putative membrane protein n=1 Tax=Clostridium bornimense TaxID=1216932 RepID=W6RXX2_9CLOT|nr:hypothetical protein [Clostridium bornimense]CDM69303.1 putative membrane protein [Clostridium bornimense]